MNPGSSSKPRLAYIDWMRGLACVLMFQTHCYDSWLGGSARQSKFYMYSQLGGTFPAPLFLFLAGISFALVTVKLQRKDLSTREIARSTIWRGAEIFGYGLLFRLQEYLIAWGWAPKSDLLRVDVLNTIGMSMMLMGVMCWVVLGVRGRVSGGQQSSAPLRGAGQPLRLRSGQAAAVPTYSLVTTALGVAFGISFITPLLWTVWRPDWLPWPLQSYIDGVHNLGVPQPWLFPLFPWSAFAFAGLAVGFILQSDWIRGREARVFFAFGIVGAVLIELSRLADVAPWKVYPVYDYWRTSPQFWVLRVGMLLVILMGSYVWCRWGAGQWGFSPLIQLGQASLLVYWVHIEFVYGRVSILAKRAQTVGGASVGLLIICLAMLLLAYVRTHYSGWMKGDVARSSPRPAATPAV